VVVQFEGDVDHVDPADSYGTPEGHNVRYDDQGQIIALTLVNPKWLLERDDFEPTYPGRGGRDRSAFRH